MLESDIVLSSKAISQAKNLGMTNRTEKTLRKLVRMSVPYTHMKGNRRNKNFIINVEGKVVTGIFSLHEKTKRLKIKGKIICPDCNNDGEFCLTCNSTGFIS